MIAIHALAALALVLPVMPTPAPRCAATTTTMYSREQFPGRTASGKWTSEGNFAAVHVWDPLPFGTRLWVGDLGEFVVEDVGDMEGVVPDPWLDLLTETDAEAIEYGSRVRLVCIGGKPF